MTLSVIIITKNEERNIRRCLASLDWAEEIIIVDASSEDNTVAIAKEYTDKIYITKPDEWLGYGIQKQRALNHATSEWILNIDADETVSPALKNEIIAAINTDEADAYRVPIRMFFYGKLLKYSSSPKRHVRLFKRKNAKFSEDIVHEKIILPENSKICKLNEALVHHSFQDISHVLYKINHYSSYTAKIRIESQKPVSLLKTFFGTSWMFLRCYFLQRGFLDGKEGLLFALFNAQSTFYRGIKQQYKDN